MRMHSADGSHDHLDLLIGGEKIPVAINGSHSVGDRYAPYLARRLQQVANP